MMRSCLHVFLLCLCSLSAFAQQTAFTEYDLIKGGDSYPGDITSYNGKLFFTTYSPGGQRKLWVSDGTLAGSQMLHSGFLAAASPIYMSASPNGLIFAAGTSAGRALWRTDGTKAGTYELKKMTPLGHTTIDGLPKLCTQYKEKLYFGGIGENGEHGLWITDGTVNGTVLIKSISSKGYGPEGLIVYRNKLYFTAGDSSAGKELYVSDGTEAGTLLFKDINPGMSSSWPMGFTIFNDTLFFRAAQSDAAAPQLWYTNGTVAGTQRVPGIPEVRHVLKAFNGQLFFTSGVMLDLWMTNGRASGTQRIRDVRLGVAGLPGAWGAVYKNKIYFMAGEHGDDYRLWASDGTVGGTQKVKDTFSSPTMFVPCAFAVYNDRLYFRGTKDQIHLTPSEIYVTNGTDSGTYMLKPKWATKGHYSESLFCSFNKQLYFSYQATNNGVELFSLRDSSFPTAVRHSALMSPTLSVYPNPNNGHFTIKLSSFDADDKAMLLVYDVMGKQVYSQNIRAIATDIDLSHLPNGIYEARLSNGSGTLSNCKLIIE